MRLRILLIMKSSGRFHCFNFKHGAESRFLYSVDAKFRTSCEIVTVMVKLQWRLKRISWRINLIGTVGTYLMLSETLVLFSELTRLSFTSHRTFKLCPIFQRLFEQFLNQKEKNKMKRKKTFPSSQETFSLINNLTTGELGQKVTLQTLREFLEFKVIRFSDVAASTILNSQDKSAEGSREFTHQEFYS